MSNTYIKSIPVNLFNGIFNTTIHFTNGLNIISGVNGTGKTQLLQLLKNNKGITSDHVSKPSANLAIFPISPKRNTEKQAIDNIFQQVRTGNKTLQTFLGQIQGFQIKDSGFENYPSFAELFIQEYESLMQDGSTGYDPAIEKTTRDFNEVLAHVFPGYSIEAHWVAGQTSIVGKLDLKIKKYSTDSIPIEYLSTGERELFALLFCIFVTRDKEDVYLIDEPEIHLNWDLEKGLFQYFNWFCEKYKKQVIVVTHSRIIFKKEFYPKTQFLLWENSQIVCKSEITNQQKISIAGELSDTVNITQLLKTTFFVEDESHKIILEALAKAMNKDLMVVNCGNKSNVKSLYSFLKEKNEEVYFLVDGDNEGNKISNAHYISLQKYCIENYLLDIDILTTVLKKTKEDVQALIIECVKEHNTNKHSLVYKKLAESSSKFPFEVLDTYDGSELLKKIAVKVKKNPYDLIKETVDEMISIGKTEKVFNELMIGLK